MAMLTLLKTTDALAGKFYAINGQVFEVDTPQECPVKLAMLYMDSDTLKVEFSENDFVDIADGVLQNIAIKLNCDVKDVKKKVLPNKTVTQKVTQKVKDVLVKPEITEDEEESN